MVAENLCRRWIGIDISPKAVELEGQYSGCRNEFQFHVLEVDQVIPQRAGGCDDIEHL